MDRGYLFGIENGKFCHQNSCYSSLKMFFYYVVACTLTKKKDLYESNIHIVSGKAELRTRNFMDYFDVYYGKTFSSIGELINIPSHISYVGKLCRLKVFIKSIFFYISNHTLGSYSYALDYCMWKEFILRNHIRIVLSNGHYDRTTTFISEICKDCNVEFQMKQHGLLSREYNGPHKIYCNKVYAYDDVQAEIFRKHIIENDDCQYETWYNPGFEFKHRKFDTFTIGIIENKSVENNITEIYDILKFVTKYGKEKQNVVIMLHPLSEQSEYEDMMKDCRCNVTFTREKYFEYDLIISTPSTLAYDYVRSGYVGSILFAEYIPRVKDCLENYENITYVCSPAELERKIEETINV